MSLKKSVINDIKHEMVDYYRFLITQARLCKDEYNECCELYGITNIKSMIALDKLNIYIGAIKTFKKRTHIGLGYCFWER